MSAAGRRLDLKVGFACNNRCSFCAQGEKRARREAKGYAELVATLARERPRAEGLVLTGGEPTVHKKLLKVVQSARRLGYSPIQIQTNGRLLAYPAGVAAYLDAGATEFAISLHAPMRSVHDELTRAPGSFVQSLAGIRNVLAAGARVITNSVITQRNTELLPELVAMLAAIGVRQMQLAFVHPVGTAMELFDEVVPRLPDVVEPVLEAARVASECGVDLMTEAIPLCFLPGREELAVEARIPPTTVADLDGEPGDHSKWRVVEGKAHGPPCDACSKRHVCEGPWREYPERRGWSEFVPL